MRSKMLLSSIFFVVSILILLSLISLAISEFITSPVIAAFSLLLLAVYYIVQKKTQLLSPIVIKAYIILFLVFNIVNISLAFLPSDISKYKYSDSTFVSAYGLMPDDCTVIDNNLNESIYNEIFKKSYTRTESLRWADKDGNINILTSISKVTEFKLELHTKMFFKHCISELDDLAKVNPTPDYKLIEIIDPILGKLYLADPIEGNQKLIFMHNNEVFQFNFSNGFNYKVIIEAYKDQAQNQ